MSIISIDQKLGSISENVNQNQPQNEKKIQYKKLNEDFNLVSIKSRFTLQKIKSLMKEVKDEKINYDNIDLNNEEVKKNLIDKKIIQYFCRTKTKFKSYMPPSEEVLKNIRKFKRWQKYEIFKERGIKNYLNKLMPNYKIVQDTKKVIDDKINLYTKIKIKPNKNNSSLNILPRINNNSSVIEKEIDIINEENQSVLNSNTFKDEKKRNRSMEEISKNNFSSSKINQNSISTIPKNKRKISNITNNRSLPLIRIINKSKIKNDIKDFNSSAFEKSSFCLNKSLIPMSMDKSIKISPFGGGILHCNSIMRNRNINDLVPYYSPKKILETLNNYKIQRNKIIHNKDYIYNIDNIFITNKKNYNSFDYYDYLIF